MREFRPVVRDGIAQLGSSAWPSGASVNEMTADASAYVFRYEFDRT